MSKYDPLGDHLRDSGQESVPMTFDEIEGIIALPPSAFEHRQWWENDLSHSQARAWRRAGYRTESVDMEGCKLVFRKSTM